MSEGRERIATVYWDGDHMATDIRVQFKGEDWDGFNRALALRSAAEEFSRLLRLELSALSEADQASFGPPA